MISAVKRLPRIIDLFLSQLGQQLRCLQENATNFSSPIGGILGLFIMGEYLSVPASVGFIALFGIAVQNGLVLVSYINQLREEGKPTFQAITEASILRLRPVLMTALTTILGLVPLLLSKGMGSEVQRPLAVVVVFGLISSTFLTLILIPVLYEWFAPKLAMDTQQKTN
ncbi:MAG: efflux RND transporter permease subunit [Fibrobacteres bacterium]|nr:efflux RND transporter permease subunit [Fibrobacterota bacterium]